MIDVLVAGGGPAGLVSALYAARAGLSVTVLEPRAGPIDKACGEGLMPGAVRSLNLLGVDPPGRAIEGIAYLHADGRQRADAGFRHGPGRGVRRTALHRALSDAAQRAGVSIEATRAGEVSQSSTTVRVGAHTGRYLIAADGLHSPIRRALGLDVRGAASRRWGVRAHFPLAPWSDVVEVYWAARSEAYVTPVADDMLGVAILSGTAGSFDRALQAFPALGERLSGVEHGAPRGAGPLRQRTNSRVAGRVLLVGDAAGYVDALTGEGLAVAIASARAAVDAIAADDPAGYERAYRRVNRRPRTITEATLWAAQHARVRRALVPAAATAPAIFGRAVDLLAG